MTQNNVRAAVGIVYSFGGTERAASSMSRTARVSLPVPSLGITVAARDNSGAEIVEVLPSGMGLANWRTGDIINSVDGKAVHSPAELAAELSDRAPGTKLRIGFLVRGYWQAEAVVAFQPK